MAQQPQAVDSPTRARPRDDELLHDPPLGEHHLGRFAGYRAARTARRNILVAFALSCVVAVVAYGRYTAYLTHKRIHPWELPPQSALADRPRVLYWSEGSARLGISRDPPSAQVIQLPDREIRLADGCDHAQVKIRVEQGRTVHIETIVGKTVQVSTDLP
ncbi:MAG: hypothetical protein V3V08_09675 [Nannocystaceae bacterium]